jgi:hypothetical protein
MRCFKTCVSIAALLPAFAINVHAAKPGSGDAASCAALAGRTIASQTMIESAEYMPDGGSVGTTKVNAPFCRVIGVATPTRDSHIGFEVWLPPASQWNGNFRGEGSGGSAGAISPGPMRDALLTGYATMSTDNGHVDGADGGHGLSWAYKHPEKMIDWAWRALHRPPSPPRKPSPPFTAGRRRRAISSPARPAAIMPSWRRRAFLPTMTA